MHRHGALTQRILVLGLLAGCDYDDETEAADASQCSDCDAPVAKPAPTEDALGVKPQTTSFETPCVTNDDCDSGYCVPTRSGGSVCSEACIDSCPDGWSCRLFAGNGDDAAYVCLEDAVSLCAPCDSSSQCQQGGVGDAGARCVAHPDGVGGFCGAPCENHGDCDEGYRCVDAAERGTGVKVRQCVPKSGACACTGYAASVGASSACVVKKACVGRRACTPKGLSECVAVEVCDGLDNSCDGQIDEGYADTDVDGAADCVDPDDDDDGISDGEDGEPLLPDDDAHQCPVAPAPVLLAITPASPANDNAPLVLGTASPRAFVRFYLDPSCATPPVTFVVANDHGHFLVAVPVTDDSGSFIHADAVLPDAAPSACSKTGFPYVEDSTVPHAPALFAKPVEPAQVEVSGEGEPDSVVLVFADAYCEGVPVAALDAGAAGAFSGVVDAPGAIVVAAQTRDAAGNLSACSEAVQLGHPTDPPVDPTDPPVDPTDPPVDPTDPPVDPTDPPVDPTDPPVDPTDPPVDPTDPPGGVDTVAPTAPVLTVVTLASPGAGTAVTLSAAAEAGATVRLFVGLACDVEIANGVVAGAGAAAFAAAASPNAETWWTAEAVDAAGNVSDCSAPVSYIHDDKAPPAPTLDGAVPPLVGKSSAPAFTVTAPQAAGVSLFASADCSGIPSHGVLPPGEDAVSLALPSPMPASATVSVSAQSHDAAGNTSGCSAPRTYTQDSKPPAAPTLTTSPSPSKVLALTVTVTGEPKARAELFTAAGCEGEAHVAVIGDKSAVIALTPAPNATTTLSARLVDSAGNLSDCSKTTTWLHDDVAPMAGSVKSWSPSTPGNQLKPTATVTSEAGASVALYSDPACTKAISAPATATGATVPVPLTTAVAANASTAVYGRITDAAGNVSPCALTGTYVHDGVAPARPAVTGVSPKGPSPNPKPTVSGTADAGAEVRIYTVSTCTGLANGAVVAMPDGTFAVPLTIGVPSNQKTRLYASAVDEAGNVSPCSTTFVEYAHDADPPSPPTLSGTAPASPSATSTTPVVSGKVESGVTEVVIYKGSDCDAVAAVVAPTGGNFAVQLTVAPNSRTDITAKARDAAGNESACKKPGLVYVHDNVPPAFGPDYAGPGVSQSDATSIKVTWPAAFDAATLVNNLVYEVCVSDTCGAVCTPWVPKTTSLAGKLSTTVTGLLPNRRYTVIVRPRDQAGNLDSNTKSSSIQLPGDAVALRATGGGAATCWAGSTGRFVCFGGAAAIGPSPVEVAVGPTHACAVNPDGTVTCAGENTSGQLGTGTFAPSVEPGPVLLAPSGALKNVRSIVSGAAHTCALTNAGRVVCWGYNEHGAVGLPASAAVTRATEVAAMGHPLQGVVELASGSEHTCARLGDGTAQCWGFNWAGQLGRDGGEVEPAPARVDTAPGVGFVGLALGTDHSCGLGTDGTVWCWGFNGVGQLGKPGVLLSSTPQAVLTEARHVVAGGSHTCAASASGTVSCWGNNETGQLGIDSPALMALSPTAVPTLTGVMELAAGISHTCARTAAGRLWCWGANGSGQLGDGSNVTRKKPTLAALPGGQATQVALESGDSHSCVLQSDGTVRCWGRNEVGAAGGPPAAVRSANLVDVPLTGAISAGGSNGCALGADGQVRCWGANDQGQLGGASPPVAGTPVSVVLPQRVRSLSVGGAHTCAVLVDGTVSCWGAGGRGQLGRPGGSAPAPVEGLTGVLSVASGRDHTCVLKAGEDDGVWCWGSNDQGQLGVPAGDDRPTPVAATGAGAGPFAALEAGDAVTWALRTDGVVLAFGAGDDGLLGDGTGVSSATAVGVQGITGVARRLGGGPTHGCALVSSGGLRCWGVGSTGALGNGQLVDQGTSVAVSGVLNAFDVDAGVGSTCALRQGQGAWCWGDNAGGALGIGEKPVYSVPQQVQCLP